MQATGGRPLNSCSSVFFLNAPYVMKDFDHFMRVWKGLWGNKQETWWKRMGIYDLFGDCLSGAPTDDLNEAYLYSGGCTRIKTPLANRCYMDRSLERDGSRSVPVPLPELYESLKDGRAETSGGDCRKSLLSNYTKSDPSYDYSHLVQTGGILINKPFFDGLSEKDQSLS